MTEQKAFKRRVRDRMTKTGESYTAARQNVAQKRERLKALKESSATDGRVTDAKLKEATGKKWQQWFSILDRWGAREKTHTQIARYLHEDLEVDGWWSQHITVFYERGRGMRQKHQQKDGFSISVSRTVAVPLDELFTSVVDARRRKRWLKDGTLKLRTSQPGRSARFDWGDGTTRVNVSFDAKGSSKATVYVSHEKLPDADEAEKAKARWKERLSDLKAVLES